MGKADSLKPRTVHVEGTEGDQKGEAPSIDPLQLDNSLHHFLLNHLWSSFLSRAPWKYLCSVVSHSLSTTMSQSVIRKAFMYICVKHMRCITHYLYVSMVRKKNIE